MRVNFNLKVRFQVKVNSLACPGNLKLLAALI